MPFSLAIVAGRSLMRNLEVSCLIFDGILGLTPTSAPQGKEQNHTLQQATSREGGSSPPLLPLYSGSQYPEAVLIGDRFVFSSVTLE